MRTESLPQTDLPAHADCGSRSQWLASRLEALGLATRIPPHQRLHPRRVDVLLDGRPAALLMKPTTPLFATR